MIDVVEAIRSYNGDRDPERLSLKLAAMRKDVFSFLRGTCHLFYARLAALEMPEGAPLAWVCGDLHLENFGSYKGDNRLVYFDLNDFDEAALAPVTWELVRLLASVLVAEESLHARPRQARALAGDLIRAYADALQAGHARWIERETADGLIGQLLNGLRERRRSDLLDRYTVVRKKSRKFLCDGRRTLPVDARGDARAREIVGACDLARSDPRFYEVLDVARRIAGTGSLGVERYVVLVHGKGTHLGNYLLDVKRALPCSFAPELRWNQPEWASEAHRVVTIQRRMQAVSAAFLHPVARRRKSYVVRGLQPLEDRLSLAAPGADAENLKAAMKDLGRLAAWAQIRSAGRQGSANAESLVAYGLARKSWRDPLLAAARQCAEQVRLDWSAYSRAYDAGAFRS